MDTTYVPETERSYSRRAKYSFRSKARPRAVFTGRRIKHCVIAGIPLRAFSLRISGQTCTSRQNSRPSPSRAKIISSSFRLRIRLSGSGGKKDHSNAIIARFRERLSRLLRRFFQKSMRDLRHNANTITGRSVGILAGAMFKLFNDSQRVFYRPVRFLPTDIDYRADAPGIMLRLCLQRPVLVWLYHAFLPSLPLQGSPASCSIFRVIQASSTASAL